MKGSFILLSQIGKITNGRIYLIVLKSSGGILLRRLEAFDGKLLMKADNPEIRSGVMRRSQIDRLYRVEAVLF